MARALAWDEERFGREVAKPTLPVINLPNLDTEAEAKEAAERAAITKTISQGRDAWERIGDASSFLAWCRIGAALHCGKLYALRTSGANCAWGSTYSRAFNAWMNDHGFGAMRPSDRSHAIDLHENLPAIEQWRATLPDKQRRRLRGAQQNVKRWRKETRHSDGKHPTDLKRDAVAAWRRFVWCVRSLPAHEAGPLWEMAFNEAAAHA